MASESPKSEEPPADSAAKADEGLLLRWAKVSLVVFVLVALVWLGWRNRAWATPFAVACVVAMWSVILLARAGLWSRLKGIASPLLVVGVMLGTFFASGGWAYTYGDGTGLAITLEAPAGPVSSAVVNSSSMNLNYSFTNTGTERLRFDPGVGRPAIPPLLNLLYPNGTIVRNVALRGERVGPPISGWPDVFVELGPGESWRGVATWPQSHSSNDRPLPAGNYSAYLTWQETRCHDSELPCFIGNLTSNDVGIEFV